MDKSNLEYLGGIIYGAWMSFITAPLIVKSSVFIGSFALGLWTDLYVFILV